MNAITRFTEAFSTFTNTLSLLCSDSERISFVKDSFSRLHRTTQQQFMKVIIIPILKQLADDHVLGYTDARNRQAAALAEKMLRDLTDDDLYLPLI